MAFKANIVFHLERIQKALLQFEAEATMNVRDCTLEVRGRNRYFNFFPQFVSVRNGKISYSGHLPDNVRGFHGWTPYFNKRWPIATDKLEFKRYCTANGLPVPEYSLVSPEEFSPYIIKQRRSSFGYGIRGPFRNHDRQDARQVLQNDDYFEQFIEGDIIKAWFWDERLVCLEVRHMPSVTGDGKHTLRQLIDNLITRRGKTPDWSEIETIAACHGLTLDTVIPEQQRTLIDYRYGSLFFPLSVENSNVLKQYENSPLTQQLAAAGPILWQAIPKGIRHGTMHVADAVLDRNDKVWFLEANCNSMVHPDMYSTIFESLFGPAAEIPLAPPMPRMLSATAPVPAPAPPGHLEQAPLPPLRAQG